MAFNVQKTSIEISAVDKTKVAFDSVKSSIGSLTSQFGALTGILSAGAFVAFTKRIIDQADSMNDLSKRTGIAVEQIGAWKLATEQSGTSMEALTLALGKGSKYLVEHGDNLKKLGINAKTSEELILQLSGIISKMPSDDPRRTALAMQVLGKSVGELIPLLSEGEAGLRKMLDRGRELNPVTKEMAENADKFNDSLAELKLISNGLFVNLVGKILPSLNTYLKQLQAVVDEGDWMDKLLFFTLGYVPGKIADKTEDPSVQIQKYTQHIIELKKELAGLPNDISGFGAARRTTIEKELAQAQAGLAAQRGRLIYTPGHTAALARTGGIDEAAVNSVLTPEGAGKAEAAFKKAAAAAEKAARDKLNLEEKYFELDRDMFKDIAKRELEHEKLVKQAKDKAFETESKQYMLSKEMFDQLDKRQLEHEKLVRDRKEETAKKIQKEYEDMAKSINESLTDALLRGFESGKGFAKNFRDTLVNMFKTLVLRPVIELLLKPITGGVASILTGGTASLFSGSAAASTGTSSSIFSGLSSIGNLFSNGNAAIVSSIERLGTFLSTGTGGLGDLLGGALGQYAGAISNVLPFAGAALSLLTGDIKGAISQGIGAGIGLAIGGPVGGIVGAVASSLLGGLGGQHVIRKKFYANASVGSDGTSILNAYGNSDTKGAERAFAIGPANSFANAILQYAKAFGASVDRFNLGVQYQQKYDSYLLTIGKPIGNGSGKDLYFKSGDAEQGIAKAFLIAIQKGFVNLPEVLVDIVKRSTLGNAINDIESLSFINQAYKSLKDLPPVFEAIGYSLKNITLKDVDLLKSRLSAINTYTSLFYTQSEQFDTFTKQITTQFDALNTVMPKSRDEYRKLVDGIKVTDESTSNLFHGLVALAPAMDTYFKQLQAQADELDRLNSFDLNSFTSLAEYRAYKGVSNNYGSTFAADFTSNVRSGAIGFNASGQGNAGGNLDLVALLKELRDIAKQTLTQTADGTSLLQRFDRAGMPTRV